MTILNFKIMKKIFGLLALVFVVASLISINPMVDAQFVVDPGDKTDESEVQSNNLNPFDGDQNEGFSQNGPGLEGGGNPNGNSGNNSNTNNGSGNNTGTGGNVSGGSGTNIDDFNIIGVECIVGCSGSLLNGVTIFMRNLATPIAILVIMWGGYNFFANGLGSCKAEGKQAIMSGVIGLIIVQGAPLIVDIIQGSVVNEDQEFLNDQLLTTYITDITNLLLSLASVIAVIVVVWGGYKWMYSGLPGDQKNGLETVRN